MNEVQDCYQQKASADTPFSCHTTPLRLALILLILSLTLALLGTLVYEIQDIGKLLDLVAPAPSLASKYRGTLCLVLSTHDY